MNNMNEVKKKLEGMAEKFPDIFKNLGEQVRIMSTPKKEKNFTYNGLNAVISFLEDGRIVIKVSNMNDAERYYNTPPVYTSEEVNKEVSNSWKLGVRANEKHLMELGWWKRLFYKPQYYGTEEGKKLFE